MNKHDARLIALGLAMDAITGIIVGGLHVYSDDSAPKIEKELNKIGDMLHKKQQRLIKTTHAHK